MEYLKRRCNEHSVSGTVSHKTLATQRADIADLHTKTLNNLFSLFSEESLLEGEGELDHEEERRERDGKTLHNTKEINVQSWIEEQKGDGEGQMSPEESLFVDCKTGILHIPTLEQLDSMIRKGTCFDPLSLSSSGVSEQGTRQREQTSKPGRTHRTGEAPLVLSGRKSLLPAPPTKPPTKSMIDGALNAPSSTITALEMRTLKKRRKTLVKLPVDDIESGEKMDLKSKQGNSIGLDDKNARDRKTGHKGKAEKSSPGTKGPGQLASIQQDTRGSTGDVDETEVEPSSAGRAAFSLTFASRAKTREKFLGEFISMCHFEEGQLAKLSHFLKMHGDVDGSIDVEGFVRSMSYFFERMLVEVSPQSRERGFLEHMYEVFMDPEKDCLMDFREFAVALAGQLGCRYTCCIVLLILSCRVPDMVIVSIFYVARKILQSSIFVQKEAYGKLEDVKFSYTDLWLPFCIFLLINNFLSGSSFHSYTSPINKYIYIYIYISSLRQKVKVLFQVYDLDDDGCITIHELCDLMNKGHDATWELVDYTENFFEVMDDNADGNIDWNEFKNAVTREPLILESFSRCLPPGIVYGEVDRRSLKMLFARLALDWTLLKKLWMSLKKHAGDYFEKEIQRREELREVAREKARKEEEEANRAWKRRVSMRGGHHGARVTDDLIDELGVTLVHVEDGGEDDDDDDDSSDSSSSSSSSDSDSSSERSMNIDTIHQNQKESNQKIGFELHHDIGKKRKRRKRKKYGEAILSRERYVILSFFFFFQINLHGFDECSMTEITSI